MEKKYLKLNDIDAYKEAFYLSNKIWQIVILWDHFSKNTVGTQFVRDLDSISDNIAEGFGRYSKKDKIKNTKKRNGQKKRDLKMQWKNKKNFKWYRKCYRRRMENRISWFNFIDKNSKWYWWSNKPYKYLWFRAYW